MSRQVIEMVTTGYIFQEGRYGNEDMVLHSRYYVYDNGTHSCEMTGRLIEREDINGAVTWYRRNSTGNVKAIRVLSKMLNTFIIKEVRNG